MVRFLLTRARLPCEKGKSMEGKLGNTVGKKARRREWSLASWLLTLKASHVSSLPYTCTIVENICLLLFQNFEFCVNLYYLKMN